MTPSTNSTKKRKKEKKKSSEEQTRPRKEVEEDEGRGWGRVLGRELIGSCYEATFPDPVQMCLQGKWEDLCLRLFTPYIYFLGEITGAYGVRTPTNEGRQ